MTYRKPLEKLEAQPLWRKAIEIQQSVTEIFEQLSADDQMPLRWRFYGRAFDLASDIAEACGSFIPKDVEYSLSMARRDLFSIKDAYLYLGRQKIIEFDPQFVVDVDRLVTDIDNEIKTTWENIDETEKTGKVKGGKA